MSDISIWPALAIACGSPSARILSTSEVVVVTVAVIIEECDMGRTQTGCVVWQHVQKGSSAGISSGERLVDMYLEVRKLKIRCRLAPRDTLSRGCSAEKKTLDLDTCSRWAGWCTNTFWSTASVAAGQLGI